MTDFRQKKINHIFHYTKEFNWLKEIIITGFIPSYCEEVIDDSKFLIPMVSFCNIPINDVKYYMRYGSFGIGLSINWAIKNNISPVIYQHENTPFKTIGFQLFGVAIKQQMFQTIKHVLEEDHNKTEDYSVSPKELDDLRNSFYRFYPFFKNWKVKYNSHEIITYQEREWRYIPEFENPEEKSLILDYDEPKYSEQKSMPKPHLKNKVLGIENIDDIKYIIVRTNPQRKEIIQILSEKFGEDQIYNTIISGELLILTEEQLIEDF